MIGFISLNDINKSLEVLMAYSVVACASIFVLTYFSRKNQLANVVEAGRPSNDGIVIFAVLSLVFVVTISQVIKTNILLYAVSFLLAGIVQRKSVTFGGRPLRLVILVLLPYLLLITKAVTSTHYLPSIFLLITIFSIFLWRCGAESFAVAVLVFCTKPFYSGPFVVSDTFHGAEHFLAAMEMHQGFFKVFPNLGYLEEYPAYALAAVLKLLTGGMVQMSIQTARSLLGVTLLLVIFAQLNRQSKLLAVLFTLALPLDRVSLALALAYSVYISANYTQTAGPGPGMGRLSIFLLSLFPLLALGITPTYLLFPILALAGMLPFGNLHRKQLIIIAVVWLLISIVFNRQLLDYFATYAALSQLYDISYSTSISRLNWWDLGFWMALLFATTVVVLGIVRHSDSRVVKLLKLLVAMLVLIKSAEYGFGRIDPGFSRLVPMAVSLMLVSSFFSRRYNVIIGIMLSTIIVSYIQLDLPRNLNKHHFLWLSNPKDHPVQLSDPKVHLAREISEFAAGRQVINYSNEPALTIGITNARATPFTSPYVTVGEKAQNTVIDFMEANPDAIIYLGHDFFTFDGVDVRLRAPLVFRYLAEKYDHKKEGRNIYAIPRTGSSNDMLENIFFDQLDMKKSPIYFTNHGAGRFAYRQITISCPQQGAGRYKIINEANTLLGEFQCGTNLVPEVFFMGKVKNIQRES
jgi:hypothetical protein